MYPPNSKIARLVDPSVEPLSLADAKGYLRVETTAEDSLIGDMITAARIECEQIGDQSILTTTWKYTLDFLPASAGPFLGYPASFAGTLGSYSGRVSTNDGRVFLPMGPLIAVTSIQYIDMGGTPTTLPPTTYQVSTGTPGSIFPDYGTFFPLSQPRPSAVDIVYTAGYGADPGSVPATLRLAMRLLVAHYHRHRTTDVPVPEAVAKLVRAAKGQGNA